MERHERVELRALIPADAGELLTLQRTTYATEAQLYNDPFLPVSNHLLSSRPRRAAQRARRRRRAGRTCWATSGSRRPDPRTRRLPPYRSVRRCTRPSGRGTGSRLLGAAEARTTATRATLFTGHLSEANIRLYERYRYVVARRELFRAGVALVHLTKFL